MIRQTGITRLYRPDGSETAYSPLRILALGEKEMEFERTWPESVAFIGPALYTPPADGEKPTFIEGKRHVLITLGTHLDWHKDDVAKAATALAKTMPDWVFHFTDGSLESAECERAGNFLRMHWVDYDAWLSRYDAVIHHGGAGIMWHCIQKGSRPWCTRLTTISSIMPPGSSFSAKVSGCAADSGNLNRLVNNSSR